MGAHFVRPQPPELKLTHYRETLIELTGERGDEIKTLEKSLPLALSSRPRVIAEKRGSRFFKHSRTAGNYSLTRTYSDRSAGRDMNQNAEGTTQS